MSSYATLGDIYGNQRLGSFEGINQPYAGLGGLLDEIGRITGYSKISKAQQLQAQKAAQQARADAEKADAQARADAEKARQIAEKQDVLDYQRKTKEREMALAEQKIASETKRLATAAAHKREIEAAQIRLEQERIRAQTLAVKTAAQADTAKMVVIATAVLGAVATLAVIASKKNK